uniref:Uncharacterized protein n=1 Tax=Anguilla anguilla TaxID=7936 RepID=A0A0E9QHC2_ANGAN
MAVLHHGNTMAILHYRDQSQHTASGSKEVPNLFRDFMPTSVLNYLFSTII